LGRTAQVLPVTATRSFGSGNSHAARVVPSASTDPDAACATTPSQSDNDLDDDLTVTLSRLIRPTKAEIGRARRILHLKALAIGVVAVLSYWTLVIASVGVAVRLLSVIVLVFAVTAIATGVMHDANHGAFSRSKRINRLMGYSLDLLGGSSWLWRLKHNTLHHANTNVVGVDTDIDQAPLARMAPQQRWRRWHRYQHLYLWFLYGILALRWFLYADFATLAHNRVGTVTLPARGRGRRVAGLIAGKVVHLGWAIVIPLAFHPWWAVLAFYLTASWCVGLLLAVVFQLAHCVEEAAFVASDDHVRGRHFADHQLRTTLDVRCSVPVVGRAVRFMMGGLDFQIEHHLAPALPHTIYPKLARRVGAECAALGLPYRCHRSVTAALRSHTRWLKHMGTPPAPVTPSP
jgi:linoleoyl-CoA desaturase